MWQPEASALACERRRCESGGLESDTRSRAGQLPAARSGYTITRPGYGSRMLRSRLTRARRGDSSSAGRRMREISLERHRGCRSSDLRSGPSDTARAARPAALGHRTSAGHRHLPRARNIAADWVVQDSRRSQRAPPTARPSAARRHLGRQHRSGRICVLGSRQQRYRYWLTFLIAFIASTSWLTTSGGAGRPAGAASSGASTIPSGDSLGTTPYGC